jgi:FkbM family methyltransferase
MRRMKLLCKRVAWRILPHCLVQLIRKRHYLRLLSSWSLEKEPSFQVIKYLVRPGDYVIDIGANIGVYSKVLSELAGRNGRVYSIEPFPPTFEILRYNLRRLHLENIEPVNVAISDSEAVVTIGLPYDPSGAETHYRASIVRDRASESKIEVADVQATTLDSKFLKVCRKISFIKCDVEGHELACIKGAKEFLAQSQPAWFIEVSGDPDNTNSAACRVFEMLYDKGYTAWWFDGGELRKRSFGDRSTNYFFLTDNHMKALKESAPKLLRP